MPSQQPPQEDEFHPPWLFPSKCEMMVSICSAAARMFHNFYTSNALVEVMKFPLLFGSVISGIAFASLITELCK